MARIWMPMYWADYQKKTNHLSTLEHGAYLLLIAHYWVNGGLPDDDKRLSRIARMTLEEWDEIRETLSEFFYDGWKHKRIEEEFSIVDANSDAAREKARRRWDKKNADATAMPQHMPQQCRSNATASSQHMPSICSSPSPSPNTSSNEDVSAKPKAKTRSERTKLSAGAQPDERDRLAAQSAGLTEAQFRIQWRKFRDHHVSRGNKMADWNAAWRTWLGNIDQFQRHPPPQKASIVDINAEIKAELNGEYYGQNQQPHSSSSENVIEYRPLQAYADDGTGG